MPTPAAALKLMRSIVASLADTSEGSHYGKASFKVKRTMFATFGEEKVGDAKTKNVQTEWGMVVALEPEHYQLVLATDPRFTAFKGYPNCVFLSASEMTNRAEVRELVAESYGIVAGAKKPERRAARKKPAATAKPIGKKKSVKKKRS